MERSHSPWDLGTSLGPLFCQLPISGLELRVENGVAFSLTFSPLDTWDHGILPCLSTQRDIWPDTEGPCGAGVSHRQDGKSTGLLRQQWHWGTGDVGEGLWPLWGPQVQALPQHSGRVWLRGLQPVHHGSVGAEPAARLLHLFGHHQQHLTQALGQGSLQEGPRWEKWGD
jgi:hypothetical protein